MQLNILGCSGAKSVGRSPTSFLIDSKILFDCGSVVSKLDSRFILENIDSLLLTHSHFDHILELPFLLELFLEEGNKPFTVYASGESIKSLYSNVFNYDLWPNLFEIGERQGIKLQLKEYSDLSPVKIGGYSITPVKVNHTVPTHGFIIDDGESSLAFTGDTFATDNFWEQCNNNSNLKAIIVDVSFPSEMEKSAEVTKHMSVETLVGELEKLNSREVKILISHMKPKYIEQIKVEFENVGDKYNFTFLEDGLTLEL